MPHESALIARILRIQWDTVDAAPTDESRIEQYGCSLYLGSGPCRDPSEDKFLGLVAGISTSPNWLTQGFHDIREARESQTTEFDSLQYSAEWFERILFVSKATIRAHQEKCTIKTMLNAIDSMNILTSGQMLDSGGVCGCSCVTANVPIFEMHFDDKTGRISELTEFTESLGTPGVDSPRYYAKIVGSIESDQSITGIVVYPALSRTDEDNEDTPLRAGERRHLALRDMSTNHRAGASCGQSRVTRALRAITYVRSEKLDPRWKPPASSSPPEPHASETTKAPDPDGPPM